LAALVAATFCANAQENTKPSVKLYGFIRNYMDFDTRENLSSNSDQFNMIPKDEALNAYGDDLNQRADIHLLSITTRLGLDITGPEFLGAKTSAKIESDFAGFGTSNTVLRIRQAWAKMEWEKHSLLVGQAWHPMMGDMMPDVFSLETGAPFTPFSRTPQVRYDYKKNGWALTATALYQYQYTSYGPDGASFNYARNAVVPEIYLQAMYKKGSFMAGAGVDVLTLKPRQEYQFNGSTYKCNEDRVIGISPTLFASYKKGNWGAKGRVTYAQNAAHLSMISGYGVTKVLDNGEQEYGTINSVSGWIDVTYKESLKKGTLTWCWFAGYTKNLGCNDDIVGNIYMRGEKNMDTMWRIAPSILYTHNAMSIGLEYNATTVAYGTPDSQYKVSDTHNVINSRLCAMLRYNF
jgi:hypothetical protein